MADLVGRYHDESAPRGRDHRIVLALHPATKADQSPLISQSPLSQVSIHR